MEKKASWSWVFAVAFVLALGMLGIGIYLAAAARHFSILAVGCGAVIGVLIAWPLGLQLHAFHCASCEQAERALNSINERFEQFSILLNLISEQQLLSDRAKSIAFREKDADALRRAIQEEIHKQDWEAAAVLANEIENSFGYKQEADRLRGQIDQSRQDLVRKQVVEVAAVVDRHSRAESWPEALREAQRIANQFPERADAANMPQEVENRRIQQKQQLIGSWNDSVQRHDVDGAIEILKRLDMYLTPAEAEKYQEAARGIFKEKLNLLRTQFSVAVQDHKWIDAIQLAEAIMRDFPNTQMAKEARDMMDTLRARASGLEPAPV
ncbi:MAG TPA: hypothetical protein VKK61_08675 [Tepidisphaeraceae bacterium]|nr:hypothetical protein [Tepidisphaeraceae bacterium]